MFQSEYSPLLKLTYLDTDPETKFSSDSLGFKIRAWRFSDFTGLIDPNDSDNVNDDIKFTSYTYGKGKTYSNDKSSAGKWDYINNNYTNAPHFWFKTAGPEIFEGVMPIVNQFSNPNNNLS